MTNLSQWFDLAEQKPWQPGIYQVCWMPDHMFNWYAFWDGEDFRAIYDEIHLADKCRDEKRIEVVRKWRGLSTNPEVKKKASGNRKVTRHIVYMKIDGCALMSKIFGIYESLAEAKKKQAMHRRSSLKTIRFRTPE